MSKLDDLDNILYNSINKKTTIYKVYNPLEKTKNLMMILENEFEQFDSIKNTTWNKLSNGNKKKLILNYIETNNLSESDIIDIKRNMYNGQLNKHYNVDYDSELNKINTIK